MKINIKSMPVNNNNTPMMMIITLKENYVASGYFHFHSKT